jgi:hypothetical protein
MGSMTLPIGPGEWIVLDTSIVRGVIAGERDAMDLRSLKAARGRHPIGLADGTPIEIMDWLLNRASGEMVTRVQAALEELDPLLDLEFPIAPGPEDSSAFAGLVPFAQGRNRRDLSAFSKALWRQLRTIASREDVSRPLQYRDSTGQERVLSFLGTSGVLKTMQDGWMVHDIAKLAQETAAGDKNYGGLTDQEVEVLTRSSQRRMAENLRVPPDSPAFERVELVARYLVRWTRLAARPTYTPPREPSSNAAIDAALLNYLVMPAIVCTADKKFINSVREIPLPDRVRVMSPAELLAWLRTGVLPV